MTDTRSISVNREEHNVVIEYGVGDACGSSMMVTSGTVKVQSCEGIPDGDCTKMINDKEDIRIDDINKRIYIKVKKNDGETPRKASISIYPLIAGEDPTKCESEDDYVEIFQEGMPDTCGCGGLVINSNIAADNNTLTLEANQTGTYALFSYDIACSSFYAFSYTCENNDCPSSVRLTQAATSCSISIISPNTSTNDKKIFVTASYNGETCGEETMITIVMKGKPVEVNCCDYLNKRQDIPSIGLPIPASGGTEYIYTIGDDACSSITDSDFIRMVNGAMDYNPSHTSLSFNNGKVYITVKPNPDNAEKNIQVIPSSSKLNCPSKAVLLQQLASTAPTTATCEDSISATTDTIPDVEAVGGISLKLFTLMNSADFSAFSFEEETSTGDDALGQAQRIGNEIYFTVKPNNNDTIRTITVTPILTSKTPNERCTTKAITFNQKTNSSPVSDCSTLNRVSESFDIESVESAITVYTLTNEIEYSGYNFTVSSSLGDIYVPFTRNGNNVEALIPSNNNANSRTITITPSKINVGQCGDNKIVTINQAGTGTTPCTCDDITLVPSQNPLEIPNQTSDYVITAYTSNNLSNYNFVPNPSTGATTSINGTNLVLTIPENTGETSATVIITPTPNSCGGSCPSDKVLTVTQEGREVGPTLENACEYIGVAYSDEQLNILEMQQEVSVFTILSDEDKSAETIYSSFDFDYESSEGSSPVLISAGTSPRLIGNTVYFTIFANPVSQPRTITITPKYIGVSPAESCGSENAATIIQAFNSGPTPSPDVSAICETVLVDQRQDFNQDGYTANTFDDNTKWLYRTTSQEDFNKFYLDGIENWFGTASTVHTYSSTLTYYIAYINRVDPLPSGEENRTQTLTLYAQDGSIDGSCGLTKLIGIYQKDTQCHSDNVLVKWPTAPSTFLSNAIDGTNCIDDGYSLYHVGTFHYRGCDVDCLAEYVYPNQQPTSCAASNDLSKLKLINYRGQVPDYYFHKSSEDGIYSIYVKISCNPTDETKEYVFDLKHDDREYPYGNFSRLITQSGMAESISTSYNSDFSGGQVDGTEQTQALIATISGWGDHVTKDKDIFFSSNTSNWITNITTADTLGRTAITCDIDEYILLNGESTPREGNLVFSGNSKCSACTTPVVKNLKYTQSPITVTKNGEIEDIPASGTNDEWITVATYDVSKAVKGTFSFTTESQSIAIDESSYDASTRKITIKAKCDANTSTHSRTAVVTVHYNYNGEITTTITIRQLHS